jgi:hypothetical protein
MHPELNMMLANLHHEELTSHTLQVDRRTRRRFFKRRREVDTRRVA